MSARTLTVWLPVDPETVRRKLRDYGLGSPGYIDDCATELAQMGYQIDSAALAELRSMTDEQRCEWIALTRDLSIERVGPPPGKVAPDAAYVLYETTGRCLVTSDADESPAASRSRH